MTNLIEKHFNKLIIVIPLLITTAILIAVLTNPEVIYKLKHS